MYLISPVCYAYLQSLECIRLPLQINLMKLCSNIGLENEFSSYLETVTAGFDSLQCNVIIRMGKIHIKSDVSCKGGRTLGSTVISNKPTKTLFAVMVSSLYQKVSNCMTLPLL